MDEFRTFKVQVSQRVFRILLSFSDFTWNRFPGFKKFKKCPFFIFKTSEFQIFVDFSLLAWQNFFYSKSRAFKNAKTAVFNFWKHQNWFHVKSEEQGNSKNFHTEGLAYLGFWIIHCICTNWIWPSSWQSW